MVVFDALEGRGSPHPFQTLPCPLQVRGLVASRHCERQGGARTSAEARMTFSPLCGRICNEHIVLPFNLLPLSLMSLHLPLVSRTLMLSLQHGRPVSLSLSLTHPCYLQPVPVFPQMILFVFLELLNSFQRMPFVCGWNVFSMIPV